MPIEYIEGDLLEANETVIVHGCNAQGKMKSGVAKAIREKWPLAYDRYMEYYKWFNKADSGLRLGQIIPARVDEDTIVVNAITQEHYGRDPKIQYVDYGAIKRSMAGVRQLLRHYDLKEVAMPKIGAGLGNGDWDKISKIIETELPGITVKVYVK